MLEEGGVVCAVIVVFFVDGILGEKTERVASPVDPPEWRDVRGVHALSHDERVIESQVMRGV